MGFCIKCGNELAAGDVYCLKCGYKGGKQKVPAGVYVISFYYFYVFLSCILGLAFYLISYYFRSGIFGKVFEMYFSSEANSVIYALSTFSNLATGTAALVAGVGLLKLKEWARKTAIGVEIAKLALLVIMTPFTTQLAFSSMKTAGNNQMQEQMKGFMYAPVLLGVAIGVIFALAVLIAIIIYLVKNKKIFGK